MARSHWIADAIYGVNDGLAAIFGIVAGVAGYTVSTHDVLLSGGFGTLASTLSMGAGAWLAARSVDEIQKRDERATWEKLQQDREQSVEDLFQIYTAKGFEQTGARWIAEHIASQPIVFHQELMREHHGWESGVTPHPWKSALIAGSSTLLGGLIPLLAFMVWSGRFALLAAACISLCAHFGVGSAKSLITKRNWWSGGLEMTLVGVLIGVVSYALGVWGNRLFG